MQERGPEVGTLGGRRCPPPAAEGAYLSGEKVDTCGTGSEEKVALAGDDAVVVRLEGGEELGKGLANLLDFLL